MRSLQILFFTIIIVGGFSITTFAQNKNFQEGYFVNQDGEKKEGFFNIRRIKENLVLFKLSAVGAAFKLKPADCQSISNGKGLEILSYHYENEKINEDIFLIKITTGSIELYRGVTSQKDAEEEFFIRSDASADLVKISQSAPVSVFNVLFPNCTNIFNRNVSSTQSAMIKMVKAYGECQYPDDEIRVLKHADFDKELFLGLGGFLFMSRLGDDKLLGVQKSDFIFKPGLSMNLSYDFTQRFGASIGIEYFNRNIEADKISILINVPIVNEDGDLIATAEGIYESPFKLRVNTLQIPFRVHYYFIPKAKVRPYLLVSFNLAFSQNVELQQFISTPSTVTPEEYFADAPIFATDELRYNSPNLLIGTGLGIHCKLGEKTALNIVGRLSQINDKFIFRVKSSNTLPFDVGQRAQYLGFDLALSFYYKIWGEQ